MADDKHFAFKKHQIEAYLKKEYQKHFGRSGRISIRKRQRFMDRVTQKVARKFGKDVLCLVDFNKHGFVTLVSPSHSESTDKGKLYKSFTHPQLAYTTHCIDRFSERTQTTENCIITLDGYLEEGLLTFGHHEGYLVSSAGVFAYEIDDGRLIIKTFINLDLLSDTQVREFYGHDVLALMATGEYISEDSMDSDIILADELPQSTPKM
ncbi:hypothetical protein [Nitrospina watsonii]|uniref:Uncharacterized protein n=1 Tax=Nitrospina watsonii TaxID=1323948 RepID=A0ABM9HEB6_9BACT|nr:hypothetical protein [Nitrospina watsonii]CAI2718390.1 conserved protein of unknown function [Nitrospina watsonii]